MADGPERGERRDPRDSARDAGAEIGTALSRAAEVAGAALIQAGQVAGDAMLGFFGRVGGRRDELVTNVVPELMPLLPAGPGDEVDTRVRVVNEGDSASEPFVLTSTDLTSEGGASIPADAVVVPPHQRVLAGNASDTVPLTLKVPADAKPGVYSGELSAGTSGVAPVPLVLEVR